VNTPRPERPHTILVIEDEKVLLSLVSSILEEEGYRVLGTEDGLEALQILQKEKDAIGVVLSDLGIPSLSGGELFDALHQIKPGLRILATSGYLEAVMKQELLSRGVFDFIEKPFLPETLLKIVENAFQT
jgi:DNA-binding NtrC family response regulator